MAALAVKVEGAVFFLVKVYAPLYQTLDASGCILYHLLHGPGVGYVVAGNHRVFDVLGKVVYLEVGDRGYAALCFGRVGLLNTGFANEGHLTFARGGHLEGVTHSGHTGTNYQKVEFAYHLCVVIIYREFTKCFS